MSKSTKTLEDTTKKRKQVGNKAREINTDSNVVERILQI